MNKATKPKVVKDYDSLDFGIKEIIKLAYPFGFSESLVSYTDKEGRNRTALPFESHDKYYLIRMTLSEAVQIVDDDEDFDEEGFLKEETKEAYEEKHSEVDHSTELASSSSGSQEEMERDHH